MNSNTINLIVLDKRALLSGPNFNFTIDKKTMQEFAANFNAYELKSYMDDFDSLITGEDICFDFDFDHEHMSFEMENGIFKIYSLQFPSQMYTFEFFFEYNGNRQVIFNLMQFLLEIFAEKLLELTKKRKLSDMKLSDMKFSDMK